MDEAVLAERERLKCAGTLVNQAEAAQGERADEGDGGRDGGLVEVEAEVGRWGDLEFLNLAVCQSDF